MISKLFKSKLFFPLLIFVFALIASRVVNIDKTARFLWDESSDLVHIRQIYIDKKITLVGPISEDGSKVFGSLTYYMFLPFAIAGNFDPASTAYGAAFFGVLTGLLIFFLIYKVNKKMLWLFAPIIIAWYPLVETGRWAWNPNLIPFWVTISLIFYLRKSNLSKFLSGLTIGLTIHHHYLAIFTSIGLGLLVLYDSVKERKIAHVLSFTAGLILAVIPFVIFDLRHPPGLFLTRILYFNNLGPVGQTSVLKNILFVVNSTFQYFTQSILLKVALFGTLATMIISDIKQKSVSLKYIFVFALQIIALGFVSIYYGHYIIPTIPFFILYLVYPRRKTGKMLAYIATGILLISLISFPKQISKVSWESDIASTRFITNTIQREIKNKDLLNSNIAVLESPDPNTYGRKYRDILLIKGVILKTKGEYEISDHLFLITTSSLDVVRKDPAYEIKYFTKGELLGNWDVPGSSWKIFLLNRSPI